MPDVPIPPAPPLPPPQGTAARLGLLIPAGQATLASGPDAGGPWGDHPLLPLLTLLPDVRSCAGCVQRSVDLCDRVTGFAELRAGVAAVVAQSCTLVVPRRKGATLSGPTPKGDGALLGSPALPATAGWAGSGVPSTSLPPAVNASLAAQPGARLGFAAAPAPVHSPEVCEGDKSSRPPSPINSAGCNLLLLSARQQWEYASSHRCPGPLLLLVDGVIWKLVSLGFALTAVATEVC
jgi:hypothetical protein